MPRITLIVALLLGPTCFGCAFLQQVVPNLTLSDRTLMGVLDSIGEAEIDAARLAQEKGSATEVKAFAGRVLNEHRAWDDANRRLAAQLAVEPKRPSLAIQLQHAHEQAMRGLRALSGPAFDRAYVAYEIQQHVRAFNFVEAAAESESNAHLKQELTRTGPDLLSHISAARALERHLESDGQETVTAR